MARESIEVCRLRHAERAFGASRPGGFRTAAESAPFMLRSLGLGAGIASLAAKEGDRQVLAALIARWLLEGCPHSRYTTQDALPAGNADVIRVLLQRIGDGDRAAYRAGQIEAIAYATWLKRLAQALCPKE